MSEENVKLSIKEQIFCNEYVKNNCNGMPTDILPPHSKWSDKDDNGKIIDGGLQHIGHGVYIRFSTGVYTLNDEWEVEVSGLEHTSGGGINTIQLKRR